MNKRIKELAMQAGLSYMPSNYPDIADLYKGADFELEKFAELIIKECISACATDRLGKTIGAEELIKEHFGVE